MAKSTFRKKPKSHKKNATLNRAIAAVLGAILVVFLILKLSDNFGSQPDRIECYGGDELNLRIEAPVYLQTDAQWANEQLGESKKTVHSAGEMLCCAAMALSAEGIDTDPYRLNKELNKVDAYARNGRLVLEALNLAVPKVWKIKNPHKPNYSDIDFSLTSGSPVLARIIMSDGTRHIVLITGKVGVEYLVHDPLGSSEGYEPITKYNGQIDWIRMIVIP